MFGHNTIKLWTEWQALPSDNLVPVWNLFPMSRGCHVDQFTLWHARRCANGVGPPEMWRASQSITRQPPLPGKNVPCRGEVRNGLEWIRLHRIPMPCLALQTTRRAMQRSGRYEAHTVSTWSRAASRTRFGLGDSPTFHCTSRSVAAADGTDTVLKPQAIHKQNEVSLFLAHPIAPYETSHGIV